MAAIRGILHDYTYNTIYGPSNSGKSFVALDMAMSIATGKALWDEYWINLKQGCWQVYIAAEGHTGIYQRIMAWCKHHGVDVPGNLAVITEPVDFMDRNSVKRFGEMVRNKLPEPPKMIWIDTLQRCFGNGDENSTRDMVGYVNATKLIQTAWNTTMVNIHHTGKNEDRGPRGNVSLIGNSNALIRVSGNPADGVEVTCQKQKDGEPFRKIFLKSTKVKVDDEISSLVLTKNSEWENKWNRLKSEHKSLFQMIVSHFANVEFDKQDVVKQAQTIDKSYKRSTCESRLDRLVEMHFIIASGGQMKVNNVAITSSPMVAFGG